MICAGERLPTGQGKEVILPSLLGLLQRCRAGFNLLERFIPADQSVSLLRPVWVRIILGARVGFLPLLEIKGIQ